MYNVGITNHHFTIFYLYLCIPSEISLSIIYLFCEKSEPFLISSRKYVSYHLEIHDSRHIVKCMQDHVVRLTKPFLNDTNVVETKKLYINDHL